jgi:hypothetical protein
MAMLVVGVYLRGRASRIRPQVRLADEDRGPPLELKPPEIPSQFGWNWAKGIAFPGR